MPSYRMLIGPGNMTPPQLAFWDQAFGRLSKSAEWQKELERNDWDNSYMNSAQSRAFLDEQMKAYRGVIAELGLIKPGT
jgi:putative tricarboxylic transport membrane protein